MLTTKNHWLENMFKKSITTFLCIQFFVCVCVLWFKDYKHRIFIITMNNISLHNVFHIFSCFIVMIKKYDTKICFLCRDCDHCGNVVMIWTWNYNFNFNDNEYFKNVLIIYVYYNIYSSEHSFVDCKQISHS